MTSRRSERALAILSAALIAVAAVIALYPTAARLYDGWRASQQRSEMEAFVGALDPQVVEVALASAGAANGEIASGGDGEAGADALDLDGTGVISWLEIPKLGVEVPVYRRATDASLMAGAARVEGSSLPVGGESSNVLVVGHSGMVDSEMFDRLDLLEPGDDLVFWTLGRPFAYRVTSSEVVEPEQAEDFSIERGADLASLVTCRPIGVNSHRLVVRAERCGYDPGGARPAIAVWHVRSPLFWVALAVICCALLLLLARRRDRSQRDQDNQSSRSRRSD